MAASYLVKAPRKNGEAQKKPNLIKRAAMFFIPWKGDGITDIIRKLIFIISLIAFIVTAFPLLSDVYTMYRDEWVNKQLQNIYNPDVNGGDVRNEAGILPAFEQLLDINPDTVGYLKIPGTAIDYPVVKAEDNDYYLFRDFYGNPNKSGTVMMDHKNVVSADKTSANLVLYGHNMAIGTFFAGLGEYWRTLYDSYDGASIAYYKEHPTIVFDTLYEQAEWKIFAIGLYNVDEQYGEVFDYNNKHDFSSREDFNRYVIDIMDRSDIFTDVDITYGDQILTLSTCYWPYRSDMENVRLAIFARKVREGESTEVDVSKAEVNTYVKRWQWVYDYVGGGYDWSQSNWDRRYLLSYTEEDAQRDGYTFITNNPEDID